MSLRCTAVNSSSHNSGGGTVDTVYGFYGNITGPGITDAYSFYGVDLAGSATNPYYSWFDSQGVRRVKEDNTFDSVGQAIEALYNPQFTKYTPGAPDFERVILGRWNGNVAEIGTEKGGTGTLRALRLIGSGYKLAAFTTNGFVKTGSSDGTLSVDTATYLTAAGAVTSLAKSGSAALVGAVTLTGGTNITLTQSGQDISIAASGGGGSGTVTNAAALTNTAIMTGAGSNAAQTPSATSTLSSGGNMSLPGTFYSVGTATFGDGVVIAGDSIGVGLRLWTSWPLNWGRQTSTKLFGGTADVLEIRSASRAQALQVFGIFTDTSNYERATLSTQQGASITLAAETAGSGADDLDVIFTPAGAGKVRFGSFTALGVEVGAGTISIKDSGGTTRKTFSCGIRKVKI